MRANPDVAAKQKRREAILLVLYYNRDWVPCATIAKALRVPPTSIGSILKRLATETDDVEILTTYYFGKHGGQNRRYVYRLSSTGRRRIGQLLCKRGRSESDGKAKEEQQRARRR